MHGILSRNLLDIEQIK